MQPTRAVTAEYHRLSCFGLKAIIGTHPSFTVAVQAADGEAMIQLMSECQPEIAVLDINMPKVDGLGVARWLRSSCPEVKIVFITVHAGEDLFRGARQLGARGYLLNDISSIEILVALRAVRDRRYFVPPALMHLLASEPQATHSPSTREGDFAQLTPDRSWEVWQRDRCRTFRNLQNNRKPSDKYRSEAGHLVPHARMRYSLQHRVESIS